METRDDFTPAFSYLLCYLLEWLPETRFKLRPTSRTNGHAPGNTSGHGPSGANWGQSAGAGGHGNRIDMLAKVVSFEPEVREGHTHTHTHDVVGSWEIQICCTLNFVYPIRTAILTILCD